MEIIQFSDLHVWNLTPEFDWFPRRYIGIGNLLLNRSRTFPKAIANAFVQKLAEETADAVIFSGDLTTTAQRSEFEMGRELLQPIFDKWGDRFIAIPGNHDRYTPKVVREKWFEKYFLHEQQDKVCIKPISDSLSALCIDASFPQWFCAKGKVDKASLNKIKQLIEIEAKAKRNILLVCHYPYIFPPRLRYLSAMNHGHGLIKWTAVAEAIDHPAVIGYLQGHVHIRWALQKNSITYLNSGSAGKTDSKLENQPGYIKFKIENSKIQSVKAITLAAPNFTNWVENEVNIINIDE